MDIVGEVWKRIFSGDIKTGLQVAFVRVAGALVPCPAGRG